MFVTKYPVSFPDCCESCSFSDIDIPGVGNCGFEALAYVTKQKNQSVNHLALRISCVQYIKDHIEDLREILNCFLLASPNIRNWKKRNVVAVQNIDELLRWMSQEGTYIEEFCFPVLCHLLSNSVF